MLKILKASAGSGKTYNLAREYIRLLVSQERPDAYRHVLAVTFTNKATDEMKRRILKELSVLSATPEESPYYKDFVPKVVRDAQELQRRARNQLSAILHDYSSFAVSTIDRFFQQTLRAFSREIGQFASYQVQLDRQALVEESVDRVLDGLTEEDRTLLDWLTRGVKDDLENGRGLSLEKRLQQVGNSLQELPEGKRDFSRARLAELHKRCVSVRKAFPEKVKSAAEEVLKTLKAHSVAPEDTNGGFLKALYNYLSPDPRADVKELTGPFKRKAADPSQWFSKAKAKLGLELEGSLEEPLNAFCALFDLPYKEYMTAKVIMGQLYSLGVADELREAFVQIQKEKNVMSLDDSNTILHGIIDGSDAPFIYEKLGVRFEDFLLDEFQDTSRIQWENFSPLLHNSEASGFDSLVVGDVKQSIYRWRGSDWNLLGSRLQQEFGIPDSGVTSLDGNYRTCREIVDFNNRFFHYAAEQLDAFLGGGPLIGPLYADVVQHPHFDDPAPGSVEVQFVEDQMEELLLSLRDLRDRGAEWSDMAILVRNNSTGAEIAALLVREGIPVVSDDSLFVKTSVTVRRLVSQLSLVERPPKEAEPSVAGYLAGFLSVNIPEHYHSLTDLAEGLLRDIREADPASFDAEIPYIRSFMDYLQDWTATGGNDLDAFLRHWETAEPKIASPRAGDSVRIMTIHKAKGLEFPFVIFPFANTVTLFKDTERWCSPRGGTLGGEDGIYYVRLGSSSDRTFFRDDFLQERFYQSIDSINTFYVALTRSKYGLKIIADLPAKGVKEALQKGTPVPWGNMANLLYGFLGTGSCFIGEKYDPRTLKREQEGPQLLETGYASFPANSDGRLKFSPEAADYFGPDGNFGPEASKRIRGNVLHRILSQVRTLADIPGAVEAAVRSGELPSSLQEETENLLEERLEAVEGRGWFAPEAKVRREAAVIGADGREYRPDRVILFPDGSVDVVDYKFGSPEESYLRQVERYKALYRQMGFSPVRGYLWYFHENPGGNIVQV
ncbi:MAG: UvrD-helicase domain-containing protein [Bacteroidales bacterium]|nr:UvrD-helicase domain-containing protein [Bacteroidales bacterium]